MRQKNKVCNVSRIVLSLILIALIVYDVYASYMVSGVHLFECDSKIGYLIATTYRWSYLATFIVLLLVVLLWRNYLKYKPQKQVGQQEGNTLRAAVSEEKSDSQLHLHMIE